MAAALIHAGRIEELITRKARFEAAAAEHRDRGREAAAVSVEEYIDRVISPEIETILDKLERFANRAENPQIRDRVLSIVDGYYQAL